MSGEVTMHPVDSAHVTGVGHDGENMHVEYKGGRRYTFPGVSAEKAEEIRNSDSVGKAIQALGITGRKA